ncbi:hypothetical protein MVG78_08610 [Roseomonas gilardii subsp. gilardii]|uniref:outer membrane lipoprotein n=1 Tax=Roseomonas gilardii TaxID=257708 RepID=UPI001FF87331|nr:hypothetical protein [Roseomonas gilardii]UPG74166.1 hypothetical protein MVG78_08610 [Roseomonas gilardii subsp. gilardii]
MGLPAGMLTPRRPALLLYVLLAGCGADYTPDTYATRAVQQANKVEQGTVAGVRPIGIRADGTTGATAGAAAGGIAGSTVGQGSTAGAFGAIGGGLIGGLLGSAAERATGDTDGYEYIVRKTNGELLSVTQVDKVPLAIGQKVLVITGNQARVVPDYTVAEQPGGAAAAPHAAPAQPPGASAPAGTAGGTAAPGSAPAGAPAPPPAPVETAPLSPPASAEPSRPAETPAASPASRSLFPGFPTIGL